MLFTQTDMEILRLCAWCKDLPTCKTENLPAEIVNLVHFEFLRLARSKKSYRLTPLGYEVLHRAGFDYEPDSTYRTDEHIVTRRLQDAEIALFFRRFGADIFVDIPRAEKRYIRICLAKHK